MTDSNPSDCAVSGKGGAGWSATDRLTDMASEADRWAEIVKSFGGGGEVRYEPVGGINPADGPVALCVGGRNRLTGELVEGFWGASCDADEVEEGGIFRRSVVPTAVIVKAHMPDLAEVVGAFNVESIEARPEDFVRQRTSNRVEFESIAFNRNFLATVPDEYDPIALRELFSPGFLDWANGIDREVDFGINDRQLWFLWRMRERTAEELGMALSNAAELFRRLQWEMQENGADYYRPGPWNAGLESFPERRFEGGTQPAG